MVAFWARRMEWSGAAWLAVLVTTAVFLLTYGAFHGIGQMLLVGFVMLGICGGVVAGPTVSLIRLWMARKT